MNHLTSWEKDISSRLKSHQATPPAMGWEKLRQRLGENAPAAPPAPAPSWEKAVRPKWLRPAIFATALTAAASVALVFLIKPAVDDISIPGTPAAQAESAQPGTNNTQAEAASRRPVAYEPQDLSPTCTGASGNSGAQASTAVCASEMAFDKAASPGLPIENTATTLQASGEEKAETTGKPRSGKKEQEKAILFKTTTDNEELLRHKLFDKSKQAREYSTARRRAARHLSLSVHSATPQSDNKQKDGYANPSLLLEAMPVAASIDYAGGDMSAILSNNILSDVDTHVRHHTPLQLGFSVAYALNERWSISTGLTYTRLTTDIESGTETSYYLTSQRLHYIGLPIAARFTAFSSRYFDAYVSAGGMIEKCVDGKQTITYQIGESRKSSSEAADRVGRGLWQASLNASAGVQFNILPALGIFFEPGLTWYADDHSSLPNIRHDKPWQFTMQGGLRLTLGK